MTGLSLSKLRASRSETSAVQSSEAARIEPDTATANADSGGAFGLLRQIFGENNALAVTAPAGDQKELAASNEQSESIDIEAEGGSGSSSVKPAIATASSADSGTVSTKIELAGAAAKSADSTAKSSQVPTSPSLPIESASAAFSDLWSQISLRNTERQPVEPSYSIAAQTAVGSTGASPSAAESLFMQLEATNEPPQSTATPTSGHATLAHAPPTEDRRPESERVPQLMRPFYLTDEPATNAARRYPTDSPEPAGTLDRLSAPWFAATRQLGTMTNEPSQLDRAPPSGAVPVAYLQDSLPEPGPNTPAPVEIGLPGSGAEIADVAPDAGDADGEEEEETLADAEKLGEEPEDNSLQFLRTQTVLLEPGETRCDIGIEYTLSENDFPILLTNNNLIAGIDEVHFTGRELAVPMELRYGLLRRVQLFLQVPVGWSNTQVGLDDFDAYANDGGLGDISWGATIQLQDATKDCPYIIGTLSAQAPTGGDPFTGAIGISPTGPSLGNGFWNVAASLLIIRVYDPVVVYYGFGARHYFEHEYLGLDIDPGSEYNYTLGVGFSVNERVTLSTQFFGAYIDDFEVNGERVEDSNREPMTLRVAATFARPCDRIVEPFVAFGLTDDAVSANFGITWTY